MAAGNDALVRMLEAALREAGVLPRGAIAEVAVRRNPTFDSAIYHLALRYRRDAPAGAPGALLLKRNQDHAGAREVALYRLAQRESGSPLPLLPCYEASYDPATGASRLLLADLSATHAPAGSAHLLTGEGAPDRAALRPLLRALARFHAHWWNDPRLGSDDLPFDLYPALATAVQFDATVQRCRREWAQFRAGPGARLPAGWVERYEKALHQLPALWQRYLARRVEERRHLTLTHGSAAFTRFLAPRSARGRTYLVALEAAGANFAAFDLAALLPTVWTPQQQQLHAGYALRRYHRALLAHGVRDYPYSQLHEDYRLMRALRRFEPVSDALAGASESYWRAKMGNLLGSWKLEG
jgi:hypothetical protein